MANSAPARRADALDDALPDNITSAWIMPSRHDFSSEETGKITGGNYVGSNDRELNGCAGAGGYPTKLDGKVVSYERRGRSPRIFGHFWI
jgi:hypothetical protein